MAVPPVMAVLAQQQREIGPYLIWLGVMLAAVTVAGVILLVYRSRVLAKPPSPAPAGALEELRALLERGEVSREEYERARAALAAKITGKAVPPRGAASQPTAASTPRPARAPAGERIAKPGFDLTGRPLPRPPHPPQRPQGPLPPATDEGPDR
ncbi:MAG: SHOCT domain-containing protein [Phycisphaerales bacterium]